MNFFHPQSVQKLYVWALIFSTAIVWGTMASDTLDSRPATEVDITSTVGLMGSSQVYKDGYIRVSTLRDKKSYGIIFKARSGAVSNVALLNTPWDVRVVTIVAGGKILIDQPSSGDTEEIYVIDIQSGQLLDKFGCEHPSLSPDKRYLAFIAAYPMHSQDEDFTSDFTMLYAFDGSSATNHDRLRADFPLMDVPDRRLGVQVFPSRRSPVKPVSAEGKKRRTYAVLSEFTWSPDSGQFLFAVEQRPGVVKPEDTDNVIPTHFIAEQPTLLLVNVSLKTQNPVVTAMTAPDCSQISGLTCTLEIDQTKFGSAALQMQMSVSGRETRTETLEIPYAGFRSLIVE